MNREVCRRSPHPPLNSSLSHRTLGTKYNSTIKAVTSSEESFRYTEQKFNVGMVTSVDYNASKTQLLNAQSEMSQAKYEFIFKTKVLDFYKGIPLTLDNKQYTNPY